MNKVRITKCYVVEVVDEHENVKEYRVHGADIEAREYCFGTKEDAKQVGKRLLEWVKGAY